MAAPNLERIAASAAGKSQSRDNARDNARDRAGDLAHGGENRSYDIRIGRDGTWYYMGSPIARKPLVKLFSTVLKRVEDGSFWLITPFERGTIEVDDAPFTAVELTVKEVDGDQVLEFRSNLDDTVVAGVDNPIRVETDPDSGEPAPYVRVRDNLDALITRSVFYELVELAEERKIDGQTVLGVMSGGIFFSLGNPEAM